MLEMHAEDMNEEGPVSGSQRTSIEELVLSSARGFLYGHPLAWDVPGSDRGLAALPGTTRRRRLTGVLAARRGATRNRAPAAAEAGSCG